MPLSDQTKNQYITCPVCSGSGKNKYGADCSNCGGLGVGAFFHGRFFFYGPKLGRAMIELSNFRKKIHLIINLLSYIIGILGLISLGVWVYFASQNAAELGAFAFWREKHVLIFVFWVSLISDMFVFYRISEEIRSQHKIKPFRYEERNRDMDTPNNWQELKTAKSKYKIDVSKGFSIPANKTIEMAYLLASKLNHDKVLPIHLFISSLKDKEVVAMFARLNINSQTLVERVKKHIANIKQSEEKTALSNTLKELLVDSYLDAMKFGQKKVTTKNFIIPILKKDKILSEILYDLEVDMDKIYNVMLWFIVNEKMIENYNIYRKKAAYKPSSNMDRAYTAVATPTLNHFGHDLTLAAKWGRLEFCVARDEEIEEIFRNLESGQNCVILTGPPGVGKSLIIDGIARLMVGEDVPDILKDKRLVELDASRIISGATPAQAEGRLLVIIDEVIKSGNIILFIEIIENLIGITSGKEESLDLSDVLVNSLERQQFYCFSSATSENYTKYIEGKALGNAMTKVEINEPKGNQAIQIVESKIGYLEAKHKVYFSYNSIESVINLSDKYIHDKYLPEKAIEILQMVAVEVSRKKGEQSLATQDDVAEIISKISKVPVTKISEKEGEKLLNLEDKIHERMINQAEAVKVVAASLRRARTELRENKRPIANFLFLGPTGVGKTELAKTVSEVYFSNEKYMIRVDMSEYQHQDSIEKMIGSPDGSLGYLTEAVRKSPFSLVLLDEIEKAHPDILNLFLQVMDDGRLTDGQGRTIDFTNAIIIATSNAGALFIQEEIKKGTDIEIIRQALINEHLNKVMRPELVNRFDGIMVFEPLKMEHVIEIAKLMLAKIGRMLEAKGIAFRANEEGVKKLAEAGYDPKFGARPLRRLLQERVEDKIANLVLADELKRRDTVIIDENADINIEKGKII